VPEQFASDIQRVEEAIRKRVCIGNQVMTGKLISEMQERYTENEIIYAINNLVRNGDFR
jgi:hypothetical protein